MEHVEFSWLVVVVVVMSVCVYVRACVRALCVYVCVCVTNTCAGLAICWLEECMAPTHPLIFGRFL